jgi:hypothetical protein
MQSTSARRSESSQPHHVASSCWDTLNIKQIRKSLVPLPVL